MHLLVTVAVAAPLPRDHHTVADTFHLTLFTHQVLNPVVELCEGPNLQSIGLTPTSASDPFLRFELHQCFLGSFLRERSDLWGPLH